MCSFVNINMARMHPTNGYLVRNNNHYQNWVTAPLYYPLMNRPFHSSSFNLLQSSVYYHEPNLGSNAMLFNQWDLSVDVQRHFFETNFYYSYIREFPQPMILIR